jgi:N-acetylmuramoyl-L-alanine amidase
MAAKRKSLLCLLCFYLVGLLGNHVAYSQDKKHSSQIYMQKNTKIATPKNTKKSKNTQDVQKITKNNPSTKPINQEGSKESSKENNNEAAKDKKPVKIILDAGHGGYDPGKEKTHSKYEDEKHIVLAITKKIHNKLLMRMIGVETILTRKRDVYVTLQDRVDIATKENADLFLSIHCNSNPNREIHGTQMHIHSNAFKTSKKLALHLDKAFQNTANRKSLGLFTNRDRGFSLFVLQNSKPASVLIEVGFISNTEEEKFLNSEEGQELIADAVLQGLITFLKSQNYDVHLLPKNEKETKEVLAKNTTENAKKLVKEIEEATKKYEKVQAEEREAAKKAKIVYRIQISSSKQPISMQHYDFNKLISKNYKIDEVVTEDDKNTKRYRYLVGREENLENAQTILQEIKKYNFKDAFITSFEQ